jgi:uncharacterized protein with ATP-grasp and redox domains
MKSEPMCVPCVIKQCQRLVYALKPEREKSAAPGTEQTGERLLSQIRSYALDLASQLSLDDPPSRFTSQVLDKVYELLKTDDPYESIKKAQNELGKKIYSITSKEISKSSDPIHAAIKYAASGNIIDVGPAEIYSSHNPEITVLDEINAMANQPLAIDDYKIFQEKFRSAERILYILDNSGEIFLDKLLIERLKGPETIMAVKALPILNDAMQDDAALAGLAEYGRIITVNPARTDKPCRYLGVDFSCTTDEFNKEFENADIVIAKGHANFESLVDSERDCFFILMAKCPVVAQKLGVQIKDRVFYYSPTKGD